MIMDIIKRLLLEYGEGPWPEDEDEVDKFGNLYPEGVYQRLFRIFDADPKEFMKNILEDLKLGLDGEFNIIYKYLTEYEGRTPYYVPIEFNTSEVASFFYDDRDYDIVSMVRDYLDGNWDYGHDYECFEMDSWLLNKIDKDNMAFMREKYLENLDVEESQEDFEEFIYSEFGNDIGCAAGDAQFNADIDSLHEDFMNSIDSYLHNFNGKWDRNEGKYIGEIEFGDLLAHPDFTAALEQQLEMHNPEPADLLWELLDYDMRYGGSDVLLPSEKIRINTDRHFRYGGNGEIDWDFFNEILSDRLNYY